MTKNRQIVPRCGDGIARVLVFHRFGEEGFASDGLSNFEQRIESLLAAIYPSPSVVSVLATSSRDDGERLEMLCRAVDLDRCDAIVVESIDRLSRHDWEFYNFVCRLDQVGIRFISINDEFDSAVGDFATALRPLSGSAQMAAGSALTRNLR